MSSNRLLIFLCALCVSAVNLFAANEPVPGSLINDKIRLVTHAAEGSVPIVINAAFAVRDSDGLLRQETTGDQFYVRWTVQILKSDAVVRTLNKDEAIIPPFNWVQLPRINSEGTEPFVQIESSQTWDGKNESGQIVPGASFQFKVSGQYIRILSQNQHLTVIGITGEGTGEFDADSEAPKITITGIAADEYKNEDVRITVDITDNSGSVPEQRLELDGQTVTSPFTVSDEGKHGLFAFARDAAGNTKTEEFFFTLDKTPPEITPPAILRYSSGDVVIPAPQATDANLKEVTQQLNGAPVEPGQVVSAEAAYQLLIRAEDLAGNTSELPVDFTIDKTPPVINIVGVEPDRFYAQPATITVEVLEANPDNTLILLDNVNFISGTTVSLEGRHELLVTAIDKAQQVAQKLIRFGIDTTPPLIHLRTPQDNALVNFDSIQVSGTLQEQFLREVRVNRIKAVASSDLFVANNVHLNEGSNTITIVATDLAGSSTQQTVTVRLDQTAPSVAITSPANGTQVNQPLVSVTGSVGGDDVQSLLVNGVPALVTGSTFSVANIRISEGANVIRAVASDAASNSQEASIQVTLDTIAPRIAITKPVEGAFTTAANTEVAGFVFDLTSPVITINNTPISIQQDGTFSTTLNLEEGPNTIALIALDALGNQASANVTIIRDSSAPEVVSISPADGSSGVPADQRIAIRFSEELKKSTVTSSAVQLKTGENLITGTLQVIGSEVTFLPSQPLSGSSPYTLSVAASITDLIGNPLKAPATATFTTLDNVAPAPPAIDPPLPAITDQTSITVAGTVESNSRIEITGGAARANAIASQTGHYSAQVNLFADAVNQLSVTATDLSGNTSAAATATIIQDSIKMVVLDASYEANGSLIIDFSKPVNLASITPENIYVESSTIIQGSVSSGADPARVIFVPQTALGNSGFILKVETSVQDQGGHELEYPFSKIFNAASGNSFVQGEVYDNATGLPLAGATARQIAPVISPAPVATTDLRGQFVIPSSSGVVFLRIERQGYQAVDRTVNAPAGQAAVMFDARLEPVDSLLRSVGQASLPATLANSDSSVILEIPAAALRSSTTVRLSKRTGQSLPALLPEGWSPVAVASIDAATTFSSDVKLRVANEAALAPFTSLASAYYDGSIWRLGSPGFVTSDGKYFELETNRAGTHAFLKADSHNSPLMPLPDQPLSAAAPVENMPPGLPQLNATPMGIFPEQRAEVDTTFVGNPIRSGTPFQAITSEDFTLLSGLGSVQTTPRTADVVAYSNGDVSKGEIKFHVAPSKAIDFSKLDVGFINVEIHAYPHAVEEPNVIDAFGGTVDSTDGDLHLQIPPNSLVGPASVPVTLTSFKTDAIKLALPDYTLRVAFEVSLAGASLSSGATLDAPGSVGVSPASQLILARLAQIGSRSLWVYEGAATYDGTRIRTSAVNKSGVFGIFAADRAIALLSGSITNPQNLPAGANILVTSDQTALAALSDAASVYALSVPTGSGVATAANQITGDQGTANYNAPQNLNLHIQTTPPRIVSITPEGAGIDTNTAIRITFSEAILASSLTTSSFHLTPTVSGTILLTSNNTIAIFTPNTALTSDTQYAVVATAAITDLSGNVLADPTSTHTFRTKDTTAPSAPANAAFKLFLPENGIVRFQVPESDIEPGTSVIFFNDTQRTSISATVQNNYYTASIAGRITDIYFVLLEDAAGNQTRVDFARMEYPDGSGAVFRISGGEYTTSQGVVIEVAADTFDAATPVQLKTITPQPTEVVATPRDYANIGYFTLNLNGATAKKPIEVAFPVPQGVTITEDSQIFAAVPVEFFGRRKWMAVEPLALEDGMLRTQSPPWPGIRAGAIQPNEAYSLIMAEGVFNYYLVGSVASIPAVLEWDNTELAVVLRDVYDFIVPLPVNQNYQMTVSDLVTGAVLFQGQPVPPATEAQSTVHLQKALSADQDAPYVIGGAPLTFTSWRVGAAKGNIRTNIRFEANDANGDGIADFQGNLIITGEGGALPEDAYVAIRNNNTGELNSDVVASDGSFSVSISYTFGDPVTLLLSSVDVEPGATLRLNFSEPIGDLGIQMEFYETEDNTSKVSFSPTLLQAQQILDIAPLTNLKSDTDYTIVLKGISDFADNVMKEDFRIQFRTKVYDVSASASDGTVNDTLLLRDHLIVGKENGIEVYSTANPFDMGEPVATLPLAGGVRSLARYGEFVMAVGGGVAPNFGMLRQLDFSDFENPRLVATLILTRFVGDTSDDLLNESNPTPEGRPIKVLIAGDYAFVATIGVGVQVVDLTAMTLPIYNVKHRAYSEPNLKDMALHVREDALDILLSGSSMHTEENVDADPELEEVAVSFKAISAANFAQISRVRSTQLAGPANNIEVLHSYLIDIDADGRTGSAEDSDLDNIVTERDFAHTDPRSYELHDLAFIASGIFGIHVLDITEISDPKFLGTIKVGEGVTAADLKLDAQNLRLYVPVGADGIYIVDIKDPFLIDPDTAPQVIGKIQIENTITDGNVTIDEELNTVYVATRDKGLKSVLVGKLNAEIVTDKDSNGVYEHVGVIESEGVVVTVPLSLPEGMILPVPIPLGGGTFLPAGTPVPPGTVIPVGTAIPPGVPLSLLEGIQPTKYYVLALLPSAAGGDTGEVKVNISSTNFFDTPIKLAPGFPSTEFETTVKYKAPEDANRDSYRLYLSDPFYITGHPLLPKKEALPQDAKVLAAGDFVRVDIDSAISTNLSFVTTDLLRQSTFASRAIRLDLTDSEKPDPKQNPSIAASTYLHSGEFTYSATDLSIKGRGFDYEFNRDYESQSIYDGPLGQNWDHMYFMRLIELPNGDVIWYDGTGRKQVFYALPPPNTPILSTVFYLSLPGEFAELKKLQDGNWLIHQPDGTLYLFNNYGQLSKIQDRNENIMEFFYDPAGKLSVVLDTMGRPIGYSYNDENKLEKITDFEGRTVEFEYDTSGAHLLTKVTSPKVTDTPNGNNFPDGKTIQYNYAGGNDLKGASNMTGIINGRQQEVIANTYDTSDRIEKYKYNVFVIDFDYEERKTTLQYSSSRRFQYEFDLFGHTTKSTIPLGLDEDGTEKFAETTYDYNLDGLLTRITLPEGGTTDYVYDTTNLNRRSQSNLLKEIRTPDSRGDGLGGDAAPIISENGYETTYNQITSIKDLRGFTTSIQRDQHGNPREIRHPIAGITETYSYNKYGQVISYSDPLGDTDIYEYFTEAESAPSAVRTTDNETGGYLKRLTLAAGSTANEGQLADASPVEQKYEYDGRGNVVRSTDGRGIEALYDYNELDQVMEVVQAASESTDEAAPLFYKTQYKYDADNNFVDILTEPKSTSEESHTLIEYNVLNQQSEVKRYPDGEELLTKFHYDERGNVRLIEYPKAGTSTSFDYDARDLVKQRVEAVGAGVPEEGIYKCEYDKNGNLIKEMTPDIAVNHQYDGFDRRAKTTFGAGNYTEAILDPAGNVVTARVRDAEDRIVAETVSLYDPMNRLKEKLDKIIVPPDYTVTDEAKTEFVYDKNSRLINQYDANRALTHSVYDGLDRLRQRIDAEQNAVEWKYDKNGNVIEKKEIDKVGDGEEEFTWTYEYDTANRLTKDTNPDGKIRQYFYDERGNLTTSIDERSSYTGFKYDGLDRKVSESIAGDSESCGSDIAYSYDQNSNLIRYTDPCGNQTSYEYDLQNRLVKVTYPGQLKEEYKYKTGGSRLEHFVERTGTKVKPTYDANNRITQKEIELGGLTIGTTSEIFTYDTLDRISTATNPANMVQLKYDSLGRLLEEIQTLLPGASYTVSAEYDAVGNRTAMTYPNGMVLTSEFDSVRRPQNFYADSSLVADYSYAGPRRVESMNFGNSTGARYGYDTQKRLKEIIFRNQATALFDGIQLGYDDSDNKTSRVHVARPFLQENFTYTQKSPAQLQDSWKLYPQGTITTRPAFGLLKERFEQDEADRINRYIEADLPVKFEFNSNNQLQNITDQITAQPLASQAFDANGNQYQKRYANSGLQREIFYDYRNLPVRATTFDPTGVQTNEIHFTYDALGRRIIKEVNGQKTRYVNFGADIIQERDGAENELVSYIYQGIDRPVAAFRNTTNPTNRIIYFNTDDIGNIASLTNDSGQVVERYYYKAYGDFRITADTQSPEILRVNISADGTALEFEFSEEMTDTALSAVEINNGALTGTGMFSNAEKTKMIWTFGQQLPATGAQVEIRVTDAAQDLSLRGLIPFHTFSTYTPGTQAYIAPDPQLYTGEKIVPESTVGNLLAFQGARYEPELKMYYLRARLLDTETFQFISADPEHYLDGPNLYAALGNNPMGRRDSWGTQSVPEGKVSSDAGGGCYIDETNPDAFVNCSNKFGYNTFGLYDRYYSTKARQLAPAILEAGYGIEVATSYYINAYAWAFGFAGAGSLFSELRLLPRVLGYTAGGLAEQASNDIIDWRLSNYKEYATSALLSQAFGLGFEGVGLAYKGTSSIMFGSPKPRPAIISLFPEEETSAQISGIRKYYDELESHYDWPRVRARINQGPALARPNPAFPRNTERVELSHWTFTRGSRVPNFVKNRMWNLKPMWGSEHALADPERYQFMRTWWKDVNPLPNAAIRFWNRTPNYVKWTTATAGGGASAYETYKLLTSGQ